MLLLPAPIWITSGGIEFYDLPVLAQSSGGCMPICGFTITNLQPGKTYQLAVSTQLYLPTTLGDYQITFSSDNDILVTKNSGMPVQLDIKPGGDPNSINPSSGQQISVAILTNEGFDALAIDFQTVEFGPDGATESHGRAHVEDVDADGDMDMLLHFDTAETGIICGDTEATLKGETFAGEAITGTDAIVTVHCP